jgi:hypothetical protein
MKKVNALLRFVSAAAETKLMVFCSVILCSLVGRYECFGGILTEYAGDKMSGVILQSGLWSWGQKEP